MSAFKTMYLAMKTLFVSKVYTEPGKQSNHRRISFVCSSNRIYCLENVFKNFQRQNYANKELILIINIDHTLSDALLERFASLSHCKIFQIASYKTLGYCLNEGIKAATGSYFAKMDDDDYYSEDYLRDNFQLIERIGHALIGKSTHFVYLESINRTLKISFRKNSLMRKLKGTRFVQGGTLFTTTELVRAIPFRDLNNHEDSFLQKDFIAHNIPVYEGNPHNYLRMRYKDKSRHTHKLPDFYKYGKLAISGNVKLKAKGIDRQITIKDYE